MRNVLYVLLILVGCPLLVPYVLLNLFGGLIFACFYLPYCLFSRREQRHWHRSTRGAS